ncbi:MAG: hypothetical protein M1818_006206 [Claussenomyces sp. TS43310]|nr:MAG: hypothetical protein M1818_006206 [Claussenomyces sp. TS43310]
MAFNSKEAVYQPVAFKEAESPRTSESIESEDDNTTLLRRLPCRPSRLASWARASGITLAVINTIILISILGVVSVNRHNKECSEFECAAKNSFYSPLLEEGSGAIEYENVMFQGALEYKSIYKGPPNPELDAAWKVLQHMNNSGVAGDTIDRIGKSRIAVKYPEEQGGKYDVGIEVFHHMHCLNIIRQYTYREYYNHTATRPGSFTDSEPTIRLHIDHCIEMLRQALLCHGDVGIITYNWVEPWGIYPDFSTMHKCRKLGPIMDWANKHALPDEDPEPDSGTVWLSKPPQ